MVSVLLALVLALAFALVFAVWDDQSGRDFACECEDERECERKSLG